MTQIADIRFDAADIDTIAELTGLLAVIVSPDGKMDANARKVNSLTRKALTRAAESEAFSKAKPGDVTRLSFPTGLAADAVLIVKSPAKPDQAKPKGSGAGPGCYRR